LLGSLAVILAACGARTALVVPIAVEGGAETGADAAEEDALPTLDVFEPDAPNACPDAGATLIYVITTQSVLMSFYPPTATFTTVGTIDCPGADGTQPFSMAVDVEGTAYVEFFGGAEATGLYRVSTQDAACTPTSFVPPGGNFADFGMGFSINAGDGGDAGETLYVIGDPDGIGSGVPDFLGSLDTAALQITPIGPVTPAIQGAELCGTAAGQLFAFYPTGQSGVEGAIGEVDKKNAQLLSASILPEVNVIGGWAFAFWGGDFYTFTAPDGTDTVVQRYRPSDGSVVQVAETPGLTVVGAGVSPCAPLQ
jgi:hypothetical protein